MSQINTLELKSLSALRKLITEEYMPFLQIADQMGNLILVRAVRGYRALVLKMLLAKETATPVSSERYLELANMSYPIDPFDSGIVFMLTESESSEQNEDGLVSCVMVRRTDDLPLEIRLPEDRIDRYLAAEGEQIGDLRKWLEGTLVTFTFFDKTNLPVDDEGVPIEYLIGTRGKLSCHRSKPPGAPHDCPSFQEMALEALPISPEELAQPGHVFLFLVQHPENQLLNDPTDMKPKLFHLRTYRFTPESYEMMDVTLNGIETLPVLSIEEAKDHIVNGGVVMTTRAHSNTKIMSDETGWKYDQLLTTSSNVLMTFYDLLGKSPQDVGKFVDLLHTRRLKQVQDEMIFMEERLENTVDAIFAKHKLSLNPAGKKLLTAQVPKGKSKGDKPARGKTPEWKRVLNAVKTMYLADKKTWEAKQRKAAKAKGKKANTRRFILGGSHQASDRITRERIHDLVVEMRKDYGSSYYRMSRALEREAETQIHKQAKIDDALTEDDIIAATPIATPEELDFVKSLQKKGIRARGGVIIDPAIVNAAKSKPPPVKEDEPKPEPVTVKPVDKPRPTRWADLEYGPDGSIVTTDPAKWGDVDTTDEI